MSAARAIELLALNAAGATVLAAGVALAARLPALRRRPALLHGLWLVVLIGLMAPPGVRVALLPASLRAAVAIAPASLDPAPTRTARAGGAAALRGVTTGSGRPRPSPDLSAAERGTAPTPPGGPVPPARPGVPGLLLAAWLLGATAVAGVSAVRWRRFSRLLRPARPASPALCARADRLAKRIGLRARARILVVEARLSPAVWRGLGGARLIVPAELAAGLDDEQLDALLAHELTHLRRGDPWSRWLELGAAIVFWWHPLLPAIRRSFRAAEEQACDAAVVAALPDSRPAYARALLSTLESIAVAPRALPATVAGAAEATRIKERLTMILRTPSHPELTRAQRLALGLAAVSVVALAPAIADAPAGDDPAPAPHGVVVVDRAHEGDTSADRRAHEGDTSADSRAHEGDTSADARAREREALARLAELRRRQAQLRQELERVQVETERLESELAPGAAAAAERARVDAERVRERDRLALTEAELAERLAREADTREVNAREIERLKSLLDQARRLGADADASRDTIVELEREIERLERQAREY